MPDKASKELIELFNKACVAIYKDGSWDQWDGKPTAMNVKSYTKMMYHQSGIPCPEFEGNGVGLSRSWYKERIRNSLPSLDWIKQEIEREKSLVGFISQDPLNAEWSFSSDIKSPIDILQNVSQYAKCIDERFNIFMAQKIAEFDELFIWSSPEVAFEIVQQYYWRYVFKIEDTSDLDKYVESLNIENGLRPVVLAEYYKIKAEKPEFTFEYGGKQLPFKPSYTWEQDPPFDPLIHVVRNIISFGGIKDNGASEKWLVGVHEDLADASREHRLRFCFILVQISKKSKLKDIKPDKRFELFDNLFVWFQQFVLSGYIPANDYAAVPEHILKTFGIKEPVGG